MRKIYRYLDIFGSNNLQKSFKYCGPFITATIKLLFNLKKTQLKITRSPDLSFYLVVGSGDKWRRSKQRKNSERDSFPRDRRSNLRDCLPTCTSCFGVRGRVWGTTWTNTFSNFDKYIQQFGQIHPKQGSNLGELLWSPRLDLRRQWSISEIHEKALRIANHS